MNDTVNPRRATAASASRVQLVEAELQRKHELDMSAESTKRVKTIAGYGFAALVFVAGCGAYLLGYHDATWLLGAGCVFAWVLP